MLCDMRRRDAKSLRVVLQLRCGPDLHRTRQLQPVHAHRARQHPELQHGGLPCACELGVAQWIVVCMLTDVRCWHEHENRAVCGFGARQFGWRRHELRHRRHQACDAAIVWSGLPYVCVGARRIRGMLCRVRRGHANTDSNLSRSVYQRTGDWHVHRYSSGLVPRL